MDFDVIVIGGGLLGCFAARNLRRWDVSVLLLEEREDVCMGISRANSAIVYPGYDNKPGSLKAAMTVRANLGFEELCRELEVSFSRCGSLLVTYEKEAVARLRKKLDQGMKNGVPGLKLLTGEEALALEPMLRPGVAAALYAPTTGTVNPWALGIAAYENALQNGARARMNEAVTAIEKREGGYCVRTRNSEYTCRAVINCAGLYADRVQELLFPPSVRLRWDGAEYLVLDELAEKPSRVIFHQADRCGKGITAIPCVEGNLLISGSRKELARPFATTAQGLAHLRQDTRALLPEAQLDLTIRSFAAVRPNPYLENGESLSDYCIENPGEGFYSLIGVKTPGLTCANELGAHVAAMAAGQLRAAENSRFDPHRRAICREDGPMVCHCGCVTEGAVWEAIARGATTVDGVKRRVGTGMGRCQGSRCGWAIQRLLEEYGHGAI